MTALGAAFWPLQLARELDDAILHIRLNELDVAAIVFKSSGDPEQVLAYDRFLDANPSHWLAREIRLLWKRVLKRVDLTSRSLVTLISSPARALPARSPSCRSPPTAPTRRPHPSLPRKRGRVRAGVRRQ